MGGVKNQYKNKTIEEFQGENVVTCEACFANCVHVSTSDKDKKTCYRTCVMKDNCS